MIQAAQDNRTVILNGKQISSLRRALALTQEQLAAMSSGPHPLSVATLKRAERGVPVYLETARRLSELLNVSVDTLLAAGADDSAPGETNAAMPVGVAVLPFQALGNDDSSTTFGQGLVEDLTTRLSGHWFPVICRASTFDYSEESTPSQVSADLHVGYVVTGSVRRDLDKGAIRVQARLLEAKSGAQLWSGEYNRAYSDVFRIQDELTAAIVDAVRHRLLLLEVRRLETRHPSDLQSWELCVRGAHLFYQKTPLCNGQARTFLIRALQSDPDSAWPMYLLAMSHQQDIVNQWAADASWSLKTLCDVAGEYQRRHPADPRAQLTSAYASLYVGKHERAAELLQRSIEGGPNLHVSYLLWGQTLAMRGLPDDAIEQFEIATRLSPRDVDLWSVRTATALAHFVADRLEEALRWAEAALETRPDLVFTYGTVASISALLGDLRKARGLVCKMTLANPQVSLERFAPLVASTQPDIAKRYLEGLRTAGLR